MPLVPRRHQQPKILAEKGVDAGAVKGTGVDGRITKEDAVEVRKGGKPKAESTKSLKHRKQLQHK
jgi:pyruvate/2-oxoglutarate dehydrogenase complex dihydrolipoamide acyltransferase (E2) component